MHHKEWNAGVIHIPEGTTPTKSSVFQRRCVFVWCYGPIAISVLYMLTERIVVVILVDMHKLHKYYKITNVSRRTAQHVLCYCGAFVPFLDVNARDAQVTHTRLFACQITCFAIVLV